MATTVKVTVSVPNELRDEMNKVSGQVNWSAVATEAFRAKLGELDRLKRATKMTKESTLKRLRSEQDNGGKEDYLDGHAAGRQWASKHAKVKQLARLAAYIEQSDRDNIAWYGGEGVHFMAPYGAPHDLYFAFNPRDDNDGEAANEFWERALDNNAERRNDPDFLKGFVEGALAVWDEVKDELE